MKKKVVIVFLIFSFVILSACNKKSDVFKTKKLKVCTSFYTVYDFVKKIGGDKIEIINLVPAGVEPHDFELTPKDLVVLSKADVLFCNGLGMEAWLDKVKENLDKLEVVEIANGIEKQEEDPHVWLDPLNVKYELENIKNHLVKLDANNKEYYEKNYDIYVSKTISLNKEYEDKLKNCTKNEVVVTHKAFGYLCNRYGLRQIALSGVLDDNEPSMKKMSETIKFMKDNNIKSVFVESDKDKKIMETIANETGANILKLETLENITKKDIESGRDYYNIMRANLDNLVIALT